MKKIILMMTIFICSLGMKSIAKGIGFHASGTVDVGRQKKHCQQVWLCITDFKVGIDHVLKAKEGDPTAEEHGIGVGVDGNLYLIISKALLQRSQPDKLELLAGNSTYYLDSDEILPQELLNAIHYRGASTIKSGDKIITYENGYYFIQLN